MLNIYPVKTGKDVEIAKYLQIEYIDFLKEKFAEYSNEPWFAPDIARLEQEVGDLPGPYCRPDGCLLLAKTKDKIAGCVSLKSLDKSISEMKRLYIKPESRGLGIGRQLTEAVIEQAAESGYTCIRLLSYQRMQEAINLYKSLGFYEIDPFNDDPIEDVIFMELKL